MDRVWGPPGLSGEGDEYEWLEESCGISQELDVSWQLILEHAIDAQLPEDEYDPEVIALVEYEATVLNLLTELLAKYRGSAPFPRH
jgi:hypothetical protein